MTIPGLPWRYSPDRPVNEQLSELADYLEDIHQAILFGPVSGSYLSLQFRYQASPLTTGLVDLLPVTFESRPVAVYASVDAGDIDVQIRQNGSDDVLGADLNVATSAVVDEGKDFALRRLGGTSLQLNITAVNSGTPTMVSVLLILKAISRLEPA